MPWHLRPTCLAKTEVTGMLENLSGETRLFPIIGDPIIFVKIPPRLTGDLEARGHNGICVPMQVPETDLEGVMNGLSRIPNIDGLLITMPHKFTAFAYCATSSERAKLLGVVSVMRRNPDGSWHGDMLDGLAFVKAQKDEGAQPHGARVLLVGAGAFLPSAGLAAGEFTVYKKSRSTALSADSAKNLILFSYLESQGAHANLP